MELRVEKLCKSYGDHRVLTDLSFTAGSGVTCLLGPSGAGKTTALRLILGLETPDSGTVSGLEGRRPGVVFQEDRLLEGRCAEDNLRFVLGEAYDPAAAGELLEELGLSAPEGQKVKEFSGGMKRRLALARALAIPFDLLILDEPFTGLDAENRDRAAGCIRRRAVGKPVLLVTHDTVVLPALNAAVIQLG